MVNRRRSVLHSLADLNCFSPAKQELLKTTLGMANQLRWINAIVTLRSLLVCPFFLPSISPGRCQSLMTITRKVKTHHPLYDALFSSNGHEALTTARRHCRLKEWHTNKQRQIIDWNLSKLVVRIFIITKLKTWSNWSAIGASYRRAGRP